MQKRSLEISCYVLGAGAFGVFFRWLQDQMAFDDAGLAQDSMFNFLVPLLVLGAALLFDRFIDRARKEKYYIPNDFCQALQNRGRVFTLARWACGLMMALGGVLLAATCETDPDAELLLALGLVAVAAGLAYPLVLSAANDGHGRLRHPELTCLGMSLPILLFALWLVISYKQNSLNSVIWSYLVEMATMIVGILAYFRLAGFAFGPVKTWSCLFMSMLGAMMCVTSLADERYLAMHVILVGAALQFVMYEWVLVMNMQKKQLKQKTEEGPSPDGFQRLR